MVLVIAQVRSRKDSIGEPSDQIADFACSELALGEINRACVAEAVDWGGEPSSGRGDVVVEQFESGLRNFGWAQKLLGLSTAEASGLSEAGEGSIWNGEIFDEVLLRYSAMWHQVTAPKYDCLRTMG